VAQDRAVERGRQNEPELSDWSVVPLAAAPSAVWPPGTKAQIGFMAAAPEGSGFPVRFEGFTVAGPELTRRVVDAGDGGHNQSGREEPEPAAELDG